MQEELWNLPPPDKLPMLNTHDEMTQISHIKMPHPLTEQEFEKLRLLLSVYQDGFGMLALKNGLSMPGWRDFERAVAVALGGSPPKGKGKESREGKNVFDVIVPITSEVHKGISCKMRGELDRTLNKDKRVSMELSNSAKYFWKYLETKGIDHDNYRKKAQEVGNALIDLVTSWHNKESTAVGGKVNLDESSYLVLSWNKKGDYQLHQFSLHLPNPRDLTWSFPFKKKSKEERDSLCGNDTSGTLFEWYGESGGQLKYFPLEEDAVWKSPIFQLEPLPLGEYGLLAKVKQYFPMQWKETEDLVEEK